MDNYIITIARGLGSGGSHIAKDLSQRLGIPYYDEEILQMASDLSGINISYFWAANEKVEKGTLAIYNSTGVYSGSLYSVNDKQYLSNENIFNYQAKVIKNLALDGKHSCIIVGKAANYILRSLINVVKVNIQAPEGYCIANISKRLDLNEKEAYELIQKTDKYRTDYYKYYTGRVWTDPREYDLSINTAAFGVKGAADLIIKVLEDKGLVK